MKEKSIFRHFMGYFVLLNLILLGIQLLYFWAVSISFAQAIPMPRFVYLILFTQIGLQIILYLLLSVVQTAWLWGVANHPCRLGAVSKPRPLIRWLLSIFVVSTTFILTVNGYFFPLSRFSRLISLGVPSLVVNVLFFLSSLFLIALTFNTLKCLNFKKSTWGFIFSGLVMFLITQHFEMEVKFPQQQKPNIILIGIDSLSPEYVNKKNTPTLDQFLRKSVRFTDTISPLAKTYPAWVSILTGLYPLHHHARENLMPLQFVKAEASIVWKLRELGYFTLFASDDRRFSNLDREFGFQKIIGPQVGVNEMLLGNFYDFPLSNLLINYPLSHWLFPYNYVNRASHYVYYPKAFDNAIETAINESADLGPILLAVHFTLPHWPYSWAASSPIETGEIFNMKKNKIDLYTAALRGVDQQVSTLLTHLSRHNLLSNSLVILLSDHGETLYQKGSRMTNLKNYQGIGPSSLANYVKNILYGSLEKSTGHGSDLLSPSQFHCVLGMKIFQHGKRITAAKIVGTRVALIDIAPTIYAFLNLPALHEKRHFDGISLLPVVLGKTASLIQRAFMLESGLLPNQLMSIKKAIYYAPLLYQVNRETHLLELRPDKMNEVNQMKLYGIIEKDWLFVLYPNDKHYLTVLVQLSNQQWTDQPQSSFAKNAPFKQLLKKLRIFYKQELRNYPMSRPLTFEHLK